MDEEEDRKQEILEQLNLQVFNLGFPPFTPKQQEMHNIGWVGGQYTHVLTRKC